MRGRSDRAPGRTRRLAHDEPATSSATARRQPLGTVGGAASGPDGTIAEAGAKRSNADRPASPRTAAEQLDRGADRRRSNTVPQDGAAHTVELPGLGDYRVRRRSRTDGTAARRPAARPRSQDTLSTLDRRRGLRHRPPGWSPPGIAGSAMVGVALRPLRRVAATATRVSELPLHSGEVALHERVPGVRGRPAHRGRAGRRRAQPDAGPRRFGALHARQESETRVRQFVADASHELRTPLASIRGYAELTRRGREETGPDTRHALGRIESEAERMTGLVEDLLLLARLDAGRPARSTSSTDLSPLVVDAVSDARAAGHGPPLAARAARRARARARRRGPAAAGAGQSAGQRPHAHPPGTTVTARVRRRRGRRGCALDVEDDGPGIPPDLLPHVFERFARGDCLALPRRRVAPGSAWPSCRPWWPRTAAR